MPFLAPVVAAVSGVLAGGGIGAALLKIGAGLLINVAAHALMPKPRVKLQNRTVTVREPVQPREVVYGRVRKGGTIVFIESTDKNDRDLHMVVVLSGRRVRSIGAVWFDGHLAIAADGTPVARYNGFASIQKRLGAETQTAFPGLVAAVPQWTAAHRLAGCAAAYVRLRFDRSKYPGGIPNMTFDLEGRDDILDPRTGQRGYTANAALCVADYLADPLYGLGAGADIDEDALVEAANVCDELVPRAGGGSERRYTCNGVVRASEDVKTNVEGLLTAMAGRLAWLGGRFYVRAGAWRAPAVALGEDDVAGDMALATRISMRENFNAVRGQFVSPQNDWQPDDFPALASAAYLVEDGERRWRDILLPFTTSASMAQRLARIELERARRQLTLRLTGTLSAYRAVVGDTVAMSFAPWGLAAKPFEAAGVSLSLGDGRLVPELVLRETSPLVYDWDASEEQIYAAAPQTTLPSAFDIAPPGRPVLTEELYGTRDGTGVRALLRAVWAPSPTAMIERYEVQVRRTLDETGAPTGDGFVDHGVTQLPLAEVRGIDPGTWQVRVRAVSLLGVASDWAQRTQEVLGLNAPPGALEGITIQSAGASPS